MGSYQRNKKASSNRSLDQCTRLCFSGSRLKKSNLAHGISLENTQDLYTSFCRSVIPFDCPVDQHEIICEYKNHTCLHIFIVIDLVIVVVKGSSILMLVSEYVL